MNQPAHGSALDRYVEAKTRLLKAQKAKAAAEAEYTSAFTAALSAKKELEQYGIPAK